MATVNISPTKVEMYASAQGKVHTTPSPQNELPTGLNPMRMAAFAVDEYRMKNGWPVAVPPYDVHAISSVSGSGVVLEYRRSAWELTTGALMRWIADPDSYDTTSWTWWPTQTQLPVSLHSATNFGPTMITDYEYRIGKELFVTEAVNFDADSREHFWTDLGSVLGGASGYTVIMVASMSSVYGNNQNQPYGGLWCPGRATPAGQDTFTETISSSWISVTLHGPYVFVESDQTDPTRALAVSNLLASAQPMLIALVIGRPYTEVYAGFGPSGILHGRAFTGSDIEPLSMQVVLGRDNGNVLHTANMALLDLGIYANRLSMADIKTEFALLSGVYGGDR